MSRILVVLAIVLAVVVTQATPDGTFLTVDLDETAAALDSDGVMEPQPTPEIPAPSANPGSLWREATHLDGRLNWCDVFRPPAALA